MNFFESLKYAMIIIIISCNSKTEKSYNIDGYYSVDKTIVGDRQKEKFKYDYIFLKKDKTFKLQNCSSNIFLKGKWQAKNLRKDEPSDLIFSFDNYSIKGSIKNSIISFQYPNDLNNGFYKMSLYVKLTERPTCLDSIK